MQSRVIVFYTPASPSIDVIATLSEALSNDERSRAARFVFSKHRHQFITAHALLHYALWRKTGIRGWRFRSDPFGKPRVVFSADHPGVFFNLSHSGQLAACAVSADHDIGIDVEEAKEDFDFADIVAGHFSQEEQAQVAAQPGASRSEAFFRLWTLKEATLKATGYGLSAPLQSFVFTLEPLRLVIAPGPDDTCRGWHIEQRRLSPSHWASLAVPLQAQAKASVEWQPIDPAEIVSALLTAPKTTHVRRPGTI